MSLMQTITLLPTDYKNMIWEKARITEILKRDLDI